MKNMSFEEALKELESVVEKLESGELSLDESLAFFEKGVQLAKFLRKELGKAEKKIEILLQDEEDTLKAEPFTLETEEEQKEDADEPESGDGEDLPF